MISGQGKIAVSNTPVQISLGGLLQGLVLIAGGSNAAALTVGSSSTLVNTADGTGNGGILAAGNQLVVPLSGQSAVWVNGTAGDIFSYVGA